MYFPTKEKVVEKIEETIFYLERIAPPLNLLPFVYRNIKIVYSKLRK